MEERATEAQRTARLSFERDPSRSGSRTDQGKDVLWVVPAETKLPPKVVGIAVSNDPLDRGMLWPHNRPYLSFYINSTKVVGIWSNITLETGFFF